MAWDIGWRLVRHWGDLHDDAIFEREVLEVELENHMYNVAMFKMEKAMFEREALATVWDIVNHEHHRIAAYCLGAWQEG